MLGCCRQHTSAVSPPPPSHCPGPAPQGQPGKVEVSPGPHRAPPGRAENMPLKLMGKALFKVRAGPMGVEYTCWDGPLSEFVMFLGLGYRGESNFLVCLLLKVN